MLVMNKELLYALCCTPLVTETATVLVLDPAEGFSVIFRLVPSPWMVGHGHCVTAASPVMSAFERICDSCRQPSVFGQSNAFTD